MKKQLLTAGIMSAVGLAGITGASMAFADDNSSTNNSPMSGMVTAIADKFKLNKDDVQKVFDEQHSKMEQEHEQRVKDELATLVKDGKLTQEQADKLAAKRAELEKERQANRTNNQQKSRDDMKKEMDTKRSELETWAKDNGIDSQYLRFVMGRGGHGGGEHGGPKG